MIKDKLGIMPAAVCSSGWQKGKAWVQTGDQVVLVVLSRDVSQQKQRASSKRREHTPGHRWIRVHELPRGLALSCWWRPSRVSYLQVLHWMGSLQMLPVLHRLTLKKRPFPGWGDTHLIHSLICELSGVFFCNNSDIQWPAGFFWEKNEPQSVLTMWSFL